MAKKLEELRVYQQAVDFAQAITALLERFAYRKDRDLWGQTSEANDSIPANIAEGFEQGTDPMFVKYLFYAKGSLAEVVARLRRAHIKRYITEEELATQVTAADQLSRSIGSLIRYLDGCGWQDRGRYQSRLRTKGPATKRPETKGLETEGLETEGPETKGPKTKGPQTKGPETYGPETRDPGTRD